MLNNLTTITNSTHPMSSSLYTFRQSFKRSTFHHRQLPAANVCHSTDRDKGEQRATPFTPTNSSDIAWDTDKEAATIDTVTSEIENWQALFFRKQLYYTIMLFLHFEKRVGKSQQVQTKKVKICLEQ